MTMSVNGEKLNLLWQFAAVLGIVELRDQRHSKALDLLFHFYQVAYFFGAIGAKAASPPSRFGIYEFLGPRRLEIASFFQIPGLTSLLSESKLRSQGRGAGTGGAKGAWPLHIFRAGCMVPPLFE